MGLGRGRFRLHAPMQVGFLERACVHPPLSDHGVACYGPFARPLCSKAVPEDEKQLLARELQTVGIPGANAGNGIMGFDVKPFFKIPFVQALDLVAKRQVRRSPNDS